MAETWTTSSFLAADVINKAIAYEEAWAAYTHPKQPFKNRQHEDEVRILKGVAHKALLDAIRALKAAS